MIENWGGIAVALVVLTMGAESLVRGSASLALRLGVTPLMVGLTVVAIGTSSPELVVSLKAGLDGMGDVAVGIVVGSNLFNLGVILGLTAVICPLPVRAQVVKLDTPVMIAACLMVPVVLLDGVVSRLEGMALLGGIVAYTGMNWVLSRREFAAQVAAQFGGKTLPNGRAWWADVLWILAGLALLVLGSRLLMEHCLVLARALGVSEAVIGLTIIAAGTSMPELATSVVAAIRKQPDIAVGNAVGSSVFNVLCILGLTATVVPVKSQGIRQTDMLWMVGLAILLLPLILIGRRLYRLEGLVLLSAYAVYLWTLWPN